MTTIPRNATRKIQAIKDRNPTCVMRSLRNDFARTPVDAKYAWEELELYRFARLTDDGDHWTIQIHGNLWYELRAPDHG